MPSACTELDAYLEQLDQRTDLNAQLLKIRKHIRKLTERYAPGLFHCYDRLRRVPLEDWRAERQRMQKHKSSFTDDRRFRRQLPKYLMELEEQAAKIARL